MTEPRWRHPRLTDAQGQMLQDSVTAAVAVAGAGFGAVVGGILGTYAPKLFGQPADRGRIRQGVLAGCLVGTVLGTVLGHRTACLALLLFEAHWGEDDDPPERPWRGWS